MTTAETEHQQSDEEEIAKSSPRPENESSDDSDGDGAGNGSDAEAKEKDEEPVTFKELGVCEELCDACDSLGYKVPTAIQRESLPHSLERKDIIGLAQTGSGKTAAFVLPMLHNLLHDETSTASGNKKLQSPYGLIMSPTRELAFQINEQVEALGSAIGIRSIVISGGVDSMAQAIALSKKPHVIVCTPGRIIDHLENTKGFTLKYVKFLVLDEADRLLTMDFEKEIEKIVVSIPKQRCTLLFSATMTSKVNKLQKVCLSNPVRVEVSSKYDTVDTLRQNYLFIPEKYKDVYLVYLATEFTGNSIIVFVDTQRHAQRITILLRCLALKATCIHGGMSQAKRLASLAKFKAAEATILVATDVASRGLDIPRVDIVSNYDIPNNGKDYIHRVGRTARAGRAGRALNLVSQYDLHNYRQVEDLIGKKLEEYSLDEATVLVMLERVNEAQRITLNEMKQLAERQKGRGKGGRGRGKRGVAHDEDEHQMTETIGEGASAAAMQRHQQQRGPRAKKRRR